MIKLYSIFWINPATGARVPVFEDKEGRYWLGGSRLHPLLFDTKDKANDCIKRIRMVETGEGWLGEDSLKVHRIEFTPI